MNEVDPLFWYAFLISGGVAFTVYIIKAITGK